MKKTLFIGTLFLICSSIFALPFNSNLSDSEKNKLLAGEVVIRNIDYSRNICLQANYDSNCAEVVKTFKDLSPKYLAEIIQVRPYEGNEDLPQKLSEVLNNISDYAGIPYWSERHEKYFDLYSTAEIVSSEKIENQTKIKAHLYMKPFGDVDENIILTEFENGLMYYAYNTNNLKYENITCVFEKKLKTQIYLFRYEDKWILYGIGGVNAPHFPFLTERIRVSFINRIKTFCNFVFTKI